MGSDKVSERDDLEQPKDSEGTHVLAGANRLESNERDLHAGEGSNGVPRAVSDIQTMGEAAHKHQHERVHGDHVGNEDISTYARAQKRQRMNAKMTHPRQPPCRNKTPQRQFRTTRFPA